MKAPPHGAQLEGVSLLLVEGHPALRAALRYFFLTARCRQVAVAATAAEAIARIRQEQPDAVLLDLELPEADALEILTNIKGDQQAPAVIVLTDNSSPHLLSRSYRLGALGYAPKLTDPDNLVWTMQCALADRRVSTSQQMQQATEWEPEDDYQEPLATSERTGKEMSYVSVPSQQLATSGTC